MSLKYAIEVAEVHWTSSSPSRQGDPPVGDVASHAQQRQRAAAELALPDEPGDLGRDRRLVGVAEPVFEDVLGDRGGPLHRRGHLRGLDQPVGELGEARLLHVVAAALATLVEPVRHPDGRGDHRPVGCRRSTACPPVGPSERAPMQNVSRSPLPLKRDPRARPSAGRLTRLRSSSAVVPRVPAPRKRLAHRRRCTRPGALAVAVRVGAVLGVADLEAAPVQRCDRGDLREGSDVGAVVLGRGQVGVVQRVLGALVAADVALAAEPAGQPGEPVEVAVGRVGDDLLGGGPPAGLRRERDRQRRGERLEAHPPGGFAQRLRLRQVGVGRGLRGSASCPPRRSGVRGRRG